MANNFDIKTKTFFQIPPSIDYGRVVFMDRGFNLNDIEQITECVQVGELWYQFDVVLDKEREPRVLHFDYKRKGDCLMAQRELSRAWTQTGEFAYEDVPSGESKAVQ